MSKFNKYFLNYILHLVLVLVSNTETHKEEEECLNWKHKMILIDYHSFLTTQYLIEPKFTFSSFNFSLMIYCFFLKRLREEKWKKIVKQITQYKTLTTKLSLLML